MLDQPILSFKNMSTTASSSDGANSATTTDGEPTTASGISSNDKEATNHQFAEVLKQTQSKMDASEAPNLAKSVEPGVSQRITIDMPESIEMTSVPLSINPIDQELVNKPLKPTLAIVAEDLTPVIADVDLQGDSVSIPLIEPMVLPNTDNVELVVTDKVELMVKDKVAMPIIDNVDVAVLDDGESPLLIDSLLPNNVDVDVDVSVNMSVSEITAIKPLDTTSLEVRPAPLLPVAAQITQQAVAAVSTPLVDETTPLLMPKINPVLNELPVSPAVVQNPLTGALSQGLLQPQMEKVAMKSLIDNEVASIDADILKSLGLSPQLASASQTNAATNSANNSQLTVTIPFQQAQWGSAVAEKVMWLSSHGLQEAEIQLDPPELGPLQVKVSVENDKAHVSFVVQHGNVREALEQTVTRLREMFEAEGIDLVNVDVSDQSQQEQTDESMTEAAADDGESNEAQSQDIEEMQNASLIQTNNGIDAYA